MQKSLFKQRREKGEDVGVRLDVDNSYEEKPLDSNIKFRLSQPEVPMPLIAQFAADDLKSFAEFSQQTITENEKLLISNCARSSAFRNCSTFEDIKKLILGRLSYQTLKFERVAIDGSGCSFWVSHLKEEEKLSEDCVFLFDIFEWIMSEESRQSLFGWQRLNTFISVQFSFPCSSSRDCGIPASSLIELIECFELTSIALEQLRRHSSPELLKNIAGVIYFHICFFTEGEQLACAANSTLLQILKEAVHGLKVSSSIPLCWEELLEEIKRISRHFPEYLSSLNTLSNRMDFLRGKKSSLPSPWLLPAWLNRLPDYSESWAEFKHSLQRQTSLYSCSHPLILALCQGDKTALIHLFALRVSFEAEKLLRPGCKGKDKVDRLFTVLKNEILQRWNISSKNTSIVLALFSFSIPSFSIRNTTEEKQREDILSLCLEGQFGQALLAREAIRMFRFFAHRPAADCPQLYFNGLIDALMKLPYVRGQLALAVTSRKAFFDLLLERFLFDSFCHPLFCRALLILLCPEGEVSALCSLLIDVVSPFLSSFVVVKTTLQARLSSLDTETIDLRKRNLPPDSLLAVALGND